MDFFLHWKSEHTILAKPPTHPNPNVFRICKSVWNIGRSLTVNLRVRIGSFEYILSTKYIKLWLNAFWPKKKKKKVCYFLLSYLANICQSILHDSNMNCNPDGVAMGTRHRDGVSSCKRGSVWSITNMGPGASDSRYGQMDSGQYSHIGPYSKQPWVWCGYQTVALKRAIPGIHDTGHLMLSYCFLINDLKKSLHALLWLIVKLTYLALKHVMGVIDCIMCTHLDQNP